jgi:hypothetical protein
MRAVNLFRQKIAEKPLRAVVDLCVDYAVYTGICFFVLFLFLSKGPLRLVDAITGLSVRERLIELIARLSSG